MTVETASYIDELNATLPNSADGAGEGDDHLRLIKTVLLTTFPNVSGAVSATDAEMNYLDITTLGTAAASKALVANGSGQINANAITWTDLGVVTTVDINGGTIDATAVGGTTPAAGAFTTLTASGAQTLTGATTLGTSLTLPAGATVTELSIDGTLAGNSDTAIPTEKAVKTYVDALDFATEAYVNARSRIQVTASIPVTSGGAAVCPVPIGVSGTIVRVDLGCWIPSTDTTMVTLKTAANSTISSNTFSATTFAVDSDTTPANASVAAGDLLKFEATATSIYAGVVTVGIVIDIS